MPFPFYLAYSAALLEKIPDVSVHVLDCLASDIGLEDFYKKCEKIQPDLIVAETSAVTFYNDMEICKNLKTINNPKIVLCGPHATVLYNDILSTYPQVDAIALGEYELSVFELLKSWNTGSMYKVKGFAWRKNGRVYSNPRPLLQDLDLLPMPAWHLFEMDLYNEPFCEGYPNFQLLSSRGCLFKCVFCLYPQTMEFGTFRAHSPQRTVEEMKFVIEKYHPKELYFDDSTFTQKKDRVVELCNLIKKEGLEVNWSCMTHAGTVTKELIFQMADAGCVAIKFGIESGNQEIIRMIRKGLSLEHAKKVIDWCREAGIRTHATYMFGLPGDTKKTVEETLKFALALGTDSAQFSIATPYPGTEFYRMAKENGWLIEQDWSRYDGNNCAVISYPGLTARDLENFLRYAQRRWIIHMMTKPRKVIDTLRGAHETEGLRGTLGTIARGVSHVIKSIKQKKWA
jgi:radical SAM superfamily enzyme YgiQ (UPF0313 family)